MGPTCEIDLGYAGDSINTYNNVKCGKEVYCWCCRRHLYICIDHWDKLSKLHKFYRFFWGKDY